MSFNYQYFVSITALSGIVIGIVYIYLNRRTKYDVFKRMAILLMVLGIFLPLLGVVGNSYMENNWEINYITSFLLFKKVTGKWFFFFNDFCVWGYISLSWGITMWIVTRKSNHGGKNAKGQ